VRSVTLGTMILDSLVQESRSTYLDVDIEEN
jgi:hypothetical protein